MVTWVLGESECTSLSGAVVSIRRIRKNYEDPKVMRVYRGFFWISRKRAYVQSTTSKQVASEKSIHSSVYRNKSTVTGLFTARAATLNRPINVFFGIFQHSHTASFETKVIAFSLPQMNCAKTKQWCWPQSGGLVLN